jgi:hypothetical protein
MEIVPQANLTVFMSFYLFSVVMLRTCEPHLQENFDVVFTNPRVLFLPLFYPWFVFQSRDKIFFVCVLASATMMSF